MFIDCNFEVWAVPGINQKWNKISCAIIFKNNLFTSFLLIVPVLEYSNCHNHLAYWFYYEYCFEFLVNLMYIAKIGDLNSLAYCTYNRNQRVLDNMTTHMVYS